MVLWCRALMFSLLLNWKSCWTNSWVAHDFETQCDITIMFSWPSELFPNTSICIKRPQGHHVIYQYLQHLNIIGDHLRKMYMISLQFWWEFLIACLFLSTVGFQQSNITPYSIQLCSGIRCKRNLTLNHLPLDKMGAILADDIFRCIFVNEKLCILIKISLKFVPKGSINNIPALV